MFKTILVPVGNDEEADGRIQSAKIVGNTFQSHIMGMHVIPTLKSLEQLTPYAYYSYDLYTSIWETQKAKAIVQKKQFIDTFENEKSSHEWHQEEGDFMDCLKRHSRLADLTIISQGMDTYSDIMGTMARFMMETSLPVLTVPEEGIEEDFSDNILIAWDASAESARAVRDAMPFLKIAKEVTVITIGEDRKEETKTEKICKTLKRHGINAKGVDEPEHHDRAARLMQLADEWDITMIVAGAWGHKRLLEIIFGGMTKTLYTNQEIPVFFAH